MSLGKDEAMLSYSVFKKLCSVFLRQASAGPGPGSHIYQCQFTHLKVKIILCSLQNTRKKIEKFNSGQPGKQNGDGAWRLGSWQSQCHRTGVRSPCSMYIKASSALRSSQPQEMQSEVKGLLGTSFHQVPTPSETLCQTLCWSERTGYDERLSQQHRTSHAQCS